MPFLKSVEIRVDHDGTAAQHPFDVPAVNGGSSLRFHRRITMFGANSLFLLDESEAAVSVHGQLQLMVRIHDLIAQGCQFVFATHSPMPMAFPEASVFEFGSDGAARTTWSRSTPSTSRPTS